jgi:hypothetical protein
MPPRRCHTAQNLVFRLYLVSRSHAQNSVRSSLHGVRSVHRRSCANQVPHTQRRFISILMHLWPVSRAPELHTAQQAARRRMLMQIASGDPQHLHRHDRQENREPRCPPRHLQRSAACRRNLPFACSGLAMCTSPARGTAGPGCTCTLPQNCAGISVSAARAPAVYSIPSSRA